MAKLLQKLNPLHRPLPSSHPLYAQSHTVSAPSDAGTRSPGPVTVVELFQSQGCNSCPPTNDALLRIIPAQSDILVLTYDVTYWDYIGWKDVFADKAFDERQREYASRWNTTRVYTPQVIVNGRREAEGPGRVDSLIEKGKKAQKAESLSVDIGLDGDEVVITGADSGRADVVAVYYDSNLHEVPVTRGENRGETLKHQNVVRKVKQVGSWTGGMQRFPVLRDAELQTAILVQDGRGGNVLAALRA